MSAIACPNCSAKTSKAAGKPYCRSCGWNISAAEEPFRLTIGVYIFVAALFGMVFILDIFKGVRLEVSAGLIVLGGTAYFVSFLFLRHFRTLRERLSIPPYRRKSWLNIEWRGKVQDTGSNPAGDDAPAPESHSDFKFEVIRTEDLSPIETENGLEPASAQIAIEMDKLRHLASIPLPRPVRLTGRGLAYLLLSTPAILAAVYFLGYRAVLDLASWGSSGGEHAWWLLIDTLFFTAVWARFLRRIKRERRLLAAGELALGRVMKQDTDRSGSSITYCFADAQARAITGAGVDRSRQYYEGMGTIVFFDRVISATNVAEPCALFKIDTRNLAHKPDELAPHS